MTTDNRRKEEESKAKTEESRENLVPLPVLDGGHIVFSFIEAIIKRPIRAKTMEKLIVPFVVFLIGFFLFVTYHDLTRLFSKFF